jgi:hypothetical protein
MAKKTATKEPIAAPETTTAKHTPGPWQTSPNDERGVYASGGASLVATCHTASLPEAEQANRMDVTAANARLIAASPDMLETLKAAMPILNAYIPPDNFDGHAARALIMVRDAIKKAQGE